VVSIYYVNNYVHHKKAKRCSQISKKIVPLLCGLRGPKKDQPLHLNKSESIQLLLMLPTKFG